MKTSLIALGIAALLGLYSMGLGEEISIQVADSGSKEIDALVLDLVSRHPAPLPHGSEFDEIDSSLFMAKRVQTAFQKLIDRGPSAFPYLVIHISDDRYSYSDEWPFGVGIERYWMNHTVGDVVREILSHDCNWDIYKARQWKDGEKSMPPPQFWEYVEAKGGVEKWAASVANKTRPQIVTEFIDWRIEVEKERGFLSDAEERETIARYLKLRDMAEQDGAGQPATAPKSKPDGKDDSKPESKGRSR
jgi:hypothetical protein